MYLPVLCLAYNHRVWSLDIAGPIRLLVINASRVTAWFTRKLGRALLRFHPEIGDSLSPDFGRAGNRGSCPDSRQLEIGNRESGGTGNCPPRNTDLDPPCCQC